MVSLSSQATMTLGFLFGLLSVISLCIWKCYLYQANVHVVELTVRCLTALVAS